MVSALRRTESLRRLPASLLLLLLLLALGLTHDGVASTAVSTQKQPTFANRLIKALGGTLCIASPLEVSNTARLKLQDCTSNDEMLFSYNSNHKIMPKVDPTKCLDVHSCSDTVGSCYLQLYDCWDGPEKNQQFEFLPSGLIKSLRVNPKDADSNDAPAFCLKPVSAKSGPIQVHLAPCDTSDVGQKFTVDNWQVSGNSGASTDAAPAKSGVSSASTSAAAQTKTSPIQPSKAAGAPHPPQVPAPGGESPIDYAQRLRTRADKGKLKTANGCTCKTSWEVEGSEFRYPNNCADPGQLKGFTWCLTEETPRCVGVDGHHHFDRCTPPAASTTAPPTQTKNKCTCKSTWEFNKRIFVAPNNCGDPDNLMGFDWCPVEGDCVGYDGKKGWDRCTRNENEIAKTTAVDSSVAAGAAKPRVVNTATDGYDSTLQKTLQGCECDSWKNWKGYSFAHNYCGNNKGKGPWCFVKDASCQGGQIFGFCAAPRITAQTATTPGSAANGGSTNTNVGVSNSGVAGGFKPANPQCGHGTMVGVSCQCDPTYAGPSCMKCADGFVNYPACISLTGEQPGIPVGAPGTSGAQVLRPQQGASVAAPNLAAPPTGRHHHLLGIFLGCAVLVCGSIAVRHLKECCARRKANRRLPEL